MKKEGFRLYKLSESLDALLDRIDDFEHPISEEEVKAALKAINEDQTALFSDLRYAAINMKAQAEVAKAEARRLQEMAAASSAKEERMKRFIMEAMQMSGLGKVAFPDGGYARIQANSQASVVFEGDAENLPEGFRREKVTYSLDADSVHQAVDMGTPLPAGITVVKGSHLRLA